MPNLIFNALTKVFWYLTTIKVGENHGLISSHLLLILVTTLSVANILQNILLQSFHGAFLSFSNKHIGKKDFRNFFLLIGIAQLLVFTYLSITTRELSVSIFFATLLFLFNYSLIAIFTSNKDFSVYFPLSLVHAFSIFSSTLFFRGSPKSLIITQSISILAVVLLIQKRYFLSQASPLKISNQQLVKFQNLTFTILGSLISIFSVFLLNHFLTRQDLLFAYVSSSFIIDAIGSVIFAPIYLKLNSLVVNSQFERSKLIDHILKTQNSILKLSALFSIPIVILSPLIIQFYFLIKSRSIAPAIYQQTTLLLGLFASTLGLRYVGNALNYPLNALNFQKRACFIQFTATSVGLIVLLFPGHFIMNLFFSQLFSYGIAFILTSRFLSVQLSAENSFKGIFIKTTALTGSLGVLAFILQSHLKFLQNVELARRLGILK